MSAPLDESHFWMGLRPVELNSVPAGLVEIVRMLAARSSAAAHCQLAAALPG
jgi:hypothetical protein